MPPKLCHRALVHCPPQIRDPHLIPAQAPWQPPRVFVQIRRERHSVSAVRYPEHHCKSQRRSPFPASPVQYTHSDGAVPGGCQVGAKSSGFGFASAPWAFLKQRSGRASDPPLNDRCSGRRKGRGGESKEREREKGRVFFLGSLKNLRGADQRGPTKEIRCLFQSTPPWAGRGRNRRQSREMSWSRPLVHRALLEETLKMPWLSRESLARRQPSTAISTGKDRPARAASRPVSSHPSSQGAGGILSLALSRPQGGREGASPRPIPRLPPSARSLN